MVNHFRWVFDQGIGSRLDNTMKKHRNNPSQLLLAQHRKHIYTSWVLNKNHDTYCRFTFTPDHIFTVVLCIKTAKFCTNRVNAIFFAHRYVQLSSCNEKSISPFRDRIKLSCHAKTNGKHLPLCLFRTQMCRSCTVMLPTINTGSFHQ